jgi:DNA-binding ferritin-like protein
MPIPQPKDNEKQADYMGRCMHKVNKDNPKMPNKQQVAICLNTYSNPKKKTKANEIEVDFSDKIKEIKEKKAQIEADKQVKTEVIVEEKKEETAPVAEVINTDTVAPASEVKAEVKIEEATASCGKPNCGSVQEVPEVEPETEVKAELDGKGEVIQTTLMQMQNQYKILHWQTMSFSQHKSFDEIVSSLIENIDEFIETYMGKYGRVIAASTFNITLANYKDTDFMSLTDKYIGFLIGLNDAFDEAQDSDLLNIRDEILGSLNQLKYLLTLV